MQSKLAIAIVGPTASGKSGFALKLAQVLGGELVCMDSATVYRGFDIGSSKPTKEDQGHVPHHLLDILDPDENFSAFDFVQKAEAAILDIQKRGKIPIVVGGTYFYLRALQKGMYPQANIPAEVLEQIDTEFFEDEAVNTTKMHAALAEKDPESAKQIHPNDRYRLQRALAIIRTTNTLPSQLKPAHLSDEQAKRVWMKYAMAISRHTLSANIVRRTDEMIRDGLTAETKALREKYPSSRPLSSIGYAESCAFLDGKLNDKQLRNEIIEKTRQLSKRQITWLRSDSEIRYIDDRDLDRVLLEVSNLRFAMGEIKTA